LRGRGCDESRFSAAGGGGEVMTEQKEAFSLGDNTLKLLSIAGPLLASSLAITHDVGFFVGTGIGFFSFFSLSEHLVFALQSLPFAIVPAAALLYWFGGVWFTFYRTGSRDGMALAEETKDTHTVKPDPMKKWRLRSYWSGVPLLFLALIAVGNGWIRQYVLGFLMVIMIIFFGIGAIIYDRWKQRQIRAATAVASVIATLILSFLIGFQQAETVLESKTASETIIVDDNKALPVRLVRGGDKGVLFFSLDTKKVSFLRWESIKQIEAGSPSSGLKHGD
jgi:hypothetical protein